MKSIDIKLTYRAEAIKLFAGKINEAIVVIVNLSRCVCRKQFDEILMQKRKKSGVAKAV
ncbi:MAG: hypothetical protein Q4F84_01810 [Fibrobacter sp.]|nr:hypothetical protein [Fibrobacter sp.]